MTARFRVGITVLVFCMIIAALAVGRRRGSPGPGLTEPAQTDSGAFAGSITQKDRDTGQTRVVTGRLGDGGDSPRSAATAVLQRSLGELAEGLSMSDLRVAREVNTLTAT